VRHERAAKASTGVDADPVRLDVGGYGRLLVGPEQRRILMVISDAAPADDSTLSINPGNYLVVSQFEN